MRLLAELPAVLSFSYFFVHISFFFPGDSFLPIAISLGTVILILVERKLSTGLVIGGAANLPNVCVS